MEKHSRVPIVAQMLIFMTLGNFSNSSYSPLAPFIKNNFILTSVQLGLIPSILFIGSVSVSLFSGFLVDRLGQYTALKVSFTIIAAGAIVTFLSHTYVSLIAGYFAIGFGYGIITPSTNSLVMRKYYPNHSTRMGVKQAGVPVGAALSAALLPFLAITFGLRTSFLAMIIIALVIAILLPREKNRMGTVNIGKGYFRDLLSTAKNRPLLSVVIASVFLSWGQQTLLTFFVIYEAFRGVPIIYAEILLVILLAGSAFGRMFWSYISDRVFNSDRVKTLSLIMALSGLFFILLNFQKGLFLLSIPIAFVIGMNAVGWNSAYVTVVSEIAPKEKVGLFSGVSLGFTGLGTIVGAPLSGYLNDSFSYGLMWTVLGISLMIVSMIFLMIARKFVYSRPPPGPTS